MEDQFPDVRKMMVAGKDAKRETHKGKGTACFGRKHHFVNITEFNVIPIKIFKLISLKNGLCLHNIG
jgi:hypothetical protein